MFSLDVFYKEQVLNCFFVYRDKLKYMQKLILIVALSSLIESFRRPL
jgi:hypothetical protein